MHKTVHLIRHGQSTFNALWENEQRDPMLFDAPLSPLGHQQVAALAERAGELAPEAVITSPFTRALQTTIGAFGHLDVPIVVEALHREYVYSSCDIGRSPRLLAEEFPDLAFDHLDDPWWYCPSGDAFSIEQEPEAVITRRLVAFRRWIGARPERRLVVVGHGTFFRLLTDRQLDNCEVMTLEL